MPDPRTVANTLAVLTIAWSWYPPVRQVTIRLKMGMEIAY